MKQFFKFLFASILGTLIGLFVAGLGFFFLMAIIVSAFSTEEVISISQKTILEIKLDYEVPERSSYAPSSNFGPLLPELVKETGVNDIIKAINNAKDDSDISGIFLNLNNLYVGDYAKLSAIRLALKDFKESGKMIFANGNRISQRAYYLASVADSIFITPTGTLDMRGLSLELMYFKKTADKLEIEPQIFQAGKYKSAIEQYSRDNMSAESQFQLDEMLKSMFDKVIAEISTDRNLDADELKNYIDEFAASSLEKSLSLGLIDGIKYFDEVISAMKKKYDIPESSSLNKIDLSDYIKVPTKSSEYTSDRIAVIYAVGEIEEGNGTEKSIGIENVSKELKEARNNSNVKAVVLRIDSPGGSPLTSEQIYREVKLTAEKKPVVASFSSVAASGGYYIATPATEIMSEPLTITGSIGAYGIVPNFKDFFENKLGITFDRVESSKYASMYSLARPLTAEEKQFIQSQVNEIYSTFISRVAEGRSMANDYVDEIGQGRVYSGLQAVEVGLVDKLGGMGHAIIRAAELAAIDKYRVVEYPTLKEPFEKIMDLLTTEVKLVFTGYDEFPIQYVLKNTRQFIIDQGIYTRLPIDISIN